MAGLGRRTFAAGEVLTAGNVMGYLQDQAVMNFAGTAARGSAIGTAVSEGMVSYLADTNAVEVYTGSGWNTVSQASSPNYVINGRMDIWQRGTSFSNPAAFTAFTADRWTQGFDGSGGTRTWTQQAHTPGAAPIAGVSEATYFLRCAQTVAGSGASYNMLFHKVEDVRTLAGQTLTFSFYAKAAAALTMPSIDFEQSFGSGGSSNVYTGLATSISVGTSWTRYSYSVTLPSLTGKTIGTNSYLGIRIFMPINATFTFDIWGVQLEAGSTATPFRRNANSIQGELAACQRYYYRSIGDSGVYTGHGTGLISGYAGGIYSYYLIPLPVTMRVAPTSIDSSAFGTFSASDGVNVSTNTALPALSTNNSSRNNAFITATHGGLTSYRPSWFQANNTTSSYIGFVAEL